MRRPFTLHLTHRHTYTVHIPHTYMHKYSCTVTHTPHTSTHTHVHIHLYTDHVHAHVYTCAHTHSHTHAHTFTHHSHAHTHAHAFTYHLHACTPLHIIISLMVPKPCTHHTHTHTHPLGSLSLPHPLSPSQDLSVWAFLRIFLSPLLCTVTGVFPRSSLPVSCALGPSRAPCGQSGRKGTSSGNLLSEYLRRLTIQMNPLGSSPSHSSVPSPYQAPFRH